MGLSCSGWPVHDPRLRRLGPRTVVLTLGGEGSLIVDQDGAHHVPSFPVSAVDTTAAGDAFVGGLAAALLQGVALREAVRFANGCGAMAVTRAGAQPSLPRRAEVELLIAAGGGR